MPTDFSKLGNAVQVIAETATPTQPLAFVGLPIKYGFNQAGTILTVVIGDSNTFEVTLANLRVAGAGSAPVSVSAAYTALSAVFGMYP